MRGTTVVVGLCLMLSVIHWATATRRYHYYPPPAEYLEDYARSPTKREVVITPEDVAVKGPTKENVKEVLQQADFALNEAINHIGETDLADGKRSDNPPDLTGWDVDVSSD